MGLIILLLICSIVCIILSIYMLMMNTLIGEERPLRFTLLVMLSIITGAISITKLLELW